MFDGVIENEWLRELATILFYIVSACIVAGCWINALESEKNLCNHQWREMDVCQDGSGNITGRVKVCERCYKIEEAKESE